MTLVKLLFLRIKFLLRLSKYIFKASLNKFYDIEPVTRVICIFANIKVEQLQISVLKWSCRVSKTVDICKMPKCIFKVPLNVLYVLGLLAHDTCIFNEYQTRAIADDCFEVII